MLVHEKEFTAIFNSGTKNFTVVIEHYDDYSDAEIFHKGNKVSLAFLEQGGWHGEPEEDNILKLCWDSGLDKHMLDWARSTGSY